MTSPETNYDNFPPFSSPPHYFSPPPPPAAKPPSQSTSPPPHVKPPPSPPHVNPPPPPPPHVLPPPPSPSPDNNTTVIVVVFVSLGCLFFLAFLSVALCCFLQKKKMVEETDITRVDEHLRIKEAVVPGPHGEQAVVLIVDDDVHIQEQIKKNEIVSQAHHSQGKSAEGIISSAIGKMQKKMIQERDSVNTDEHLKVKETMLAGPHEAQTLVLSVEDDKHIHEAIKKNERVGEGSHGKSAKGFAYSIEKNLLGAFGKGKKKMIQETEVINVDEYSTLKEEIIAGGPHGEQAVFVTKENDVHIQEEIRKIEKLGEGLHGNITCATEKA